MGIFILGAMGLYLLVSIGVVLSAAGYARKNGKSAKRWGWGAALVMYLIPFWDWLPTLAVHQYYCATEAGFWNYKTVDDWKKENPGILETLQYDKTMPRVQTQYGGAATALNERILSIRRYEGPLLLNLWRTESDLRDRKTGELIAHEVGFSTSQERRQAGWLGWKVWLTNENCDIEKHRDQGSFDKITAQFEGEK